MKQLAQKVNEDRSFDKEAYSYIKKQLDRETSKPLRKRDYDKIERLTAELAELHDNEPTDTSEGIDRLYDRIAEYERDNKKPITVIRKFIPAVCCAAVILVANCISVAAFDMNIVSAVIEFTKGGFSVDFNAEEQDIIYLPTSEDDPYGIIAECAKYGIYPETPFYLPDGFKLTGTEHNENKQATSMIFNFFNDEKSISIAYDFYFDTVGQIGIPSDYYNISETEVNGCPAIVSKEDNQFTITFVKDNTVFLMFTQDVPYDECEKIVASIK